MTKTIDKKRMLPSEREYTRLIKARDKSSPEYGKKPENRTVEEIVENGVIILDKPQGPTSHQVVSWVKKILEVDKVGHSGTLDPNATGVLPITLNAATRGSQALLVAGKEYVGVMRLHKTGVPVEKIKKTCVQFIGEITQLPPVRSAVKRVKRKRKIYYLDVLEVQNGTDVLFRVGCEAGTYIRTLCVDIGKKLGVGAHLLELRRTKVGRLHEKSAVTLQDVKDAFVFWKEKQEETDMLSAIKPMERMLDHMPKIVVRDSAVDAICHGANLAVPGVLEVDKEISKGDEAAVMTQKGEGVGLVNCLMHSWQIIEKKSGVCAETDRVLMEKGIYPSLWKKS